jgi:hypothetical protein
VRVIAVKITTMLVALIIAATTAANADWNYSTEAERDTHIAACGAKGDCSLTKPALLLWADTEGGTTVAEAPYHVCKHGQWSLMGEVYTDCCILFDSNDNPPVVHAGTCCRDGGETCVSCQGLSCAQM